MSKYEELIDTIKSRKKFINDTKNNFNTAFCKGFAKFLDCPQELIHTEFQSIGHNITNKHPA